MLWSKKWVGVAGVVQTGSCDLGQRAGGSDPHCKYYHLRCSSHYFSFHSFLYWLKWGLRIAYIHNPAFQEANVVFKTCLLLPLFWSHLCLFPFLLISFNQCERCAQSPSRFPARRHSLFGVSY